MITEANLLKTAIRQLLDFEAHEEVSSYDVWTLCRNLTAWQDQYDPDQEAFPRVEGADYDFATFSKELWPNLEEDHRFFMDNVERAFNTCLIAILSEKNDEALQVLFIINPNLVMEKFSIQDDVNLDFYYEQDEVDIMHELFISRLDSADKRLTTLNFVKRAIEELQKVGLDFYPQFRQLEQRLQDSVVVASENPEKASSKGKSKAPELVLVPGGLKDE